MSPEVSILYVEKIAAMLHVGRALALEFEDKEAAVVPGCDEVDLGMGGKDPKAVLAPVSEKMCALCGVPNSDGLVLAIAVKELRKNVL